MIDIKRRTPRFNVKFTLHSNDMQGTGVNLSQNGLGFLTNEEIIPAEAIPFDAEIKGFIFSTATYRIKGTARILYSRPTRYGEGLYYNGLEFIDLDPESRQNLFDLLTDIHSFSRNDMENLRSKTLADFVYYPSGDVFSKAEIFYGAMSRLVEQKYEMFSYYLNSTSRSTSTLRSRVTGKEKEMIMMGSNNYLGLTDHPDVKQAGIEALKTFGTGNGSGAMVGGTMIIHKQLEEELADFIGKEAVMLFNSGYSANIGAISGLMRPGDAIINDQYNHASINDGGLLSGARTLYFSHNSTKGLERVLRRAKLTYNGKMIVIDGVYSTDGSLAPLPEIVALAKRYQCRIMVDEAHGLGILGERGIGASEYFDCLDDVDMILGTLSKSLGSVGGFVAANREVIEYLRVYSRSYLFSTGFPPATAATVRAALSVMRSDNSLREQLEENIACFRKGLLERNLPTNESPSAIVPLFIPDMDTMLEFSSMLFEKGLFHNVMAYPAVPMGGSLLRFGIMATHTRDELDRALDILESVAKTVRL
jgi:8-amino-7-oxononanoate synthase